jgi:hypothetical protein
MSVGFTVSMYCLPINYQGQRSSRSVLWLQFFFFFWCKLVGQYISSFSLPCSDSLRVQGLPLMDL